MTPQEIVDAVAGLTHHEIKEFRILLCKRLGMDLSPEDDDGAAGAAVPVGPMAPNVGGVARRAVEG